LLAQCSWESGGEDAFTACDENNYTKTDAAPCSQRDDGELYASLNDESYACTVDKDMTMTAETYLTDPGPMECTPDTVTEGCCWYGRGAIQTTGPNNYGLLNEEVIKQFPSLVAKDVNICTNPEAMCQNEETKWLGAIFYWANNVQGYSDDSYYQNFITSLKAYVDGDFSLTASTVNGADFVAGTGGVVNNGSWDEAPHGAAGRLANFEAYIAELKTAGMETCQ
jgi:predicted chitinase